MSATGSRRRIDGRWFSTSSSGGFTLLELIVVLAIAGLLLAATAPASGRFYDNMVSRKAVRDTANMLMSARARALTSGIAQDVLLKPSERRVWLASSERRLPDSLTMVVHGAAELNLDAVGVIRFYPDGSSSGGGVDLARADGSGTRISVDWLIGRVRMQPLGG